MAIACDPQDLVNAAKCYDCGLPAGMQLSVLIALAAEFVGQPTDKASLQTLVNNARCLACSLYPPYGAASQGIQMATLVNLGCIIAGLGPGGPPPPPPPVSCPDPDANNFLSKAGITDTTTTNAICILVESLKSNGLWTVMDAIYPMVGGTVNSVSLNLKGPLFLPISWNGTPTINQYGVGGSISGTIALNMSAAGFNFSLNSFSYGYYRSKGSSIPVPFNGELIPDYIWGNSAFQGTATAILQINYDFSNFNPAQTHLALAFDASNSNLVASQRIDIQPTQYGLGVGTRTSSTAINTYSPAGLGVGQSVNSTSMPNQNLQLLSNVQPQESFATLFVGGGLSNTQVSTLRTILTTFNTSMGRP